MGGQVLETYADKCMKEQARKIALCLIQRGDDTEEVARITHLTEEEVEELRNQD